MRLSIFALALLLPLSACSLAAAPCRIVGAVVDVVPGGDAPASALYACGDAID